MATYIEYQLSGGETILVEVDETNSGPLKASDESGNVIVQARQRFDEALSAVRTSITIFKRELESLETDEVEVTFGLKTLGELGLFAIAKASTEVNYTLTLRWKKPR